MPITRDVLDTIIFKSYDPSVVRFLQNSPIYPSVWLAYAEIKPGNEQKLVNRRIDLILNPHFQSSAAELFSKLHSIAKKEKKLEYLRLATNAETVAAWLTFQELILGVLPLTSWWKKIWTTDTNKRDYLREKEWLFLVVGAVLTAHATKKITSLDDRSRLYMRNLGERYIQNFRKEESADKQGMVYSVSMNRPAFVSLQNSVPCTKADAGRRLFEIDGSAIKWAVLDSGIDARHPAFRKIEKTGNKPGGIFKNAFLNANGGVVNNTRIVATYDFTNFRKLISEITTKPKGAKLLTDLPTGDRDDRSLSENKKKDSIEKLVTALNDGRMLDWSVLEPLLRIPHNEKLYKSPQHPHGTHVAGIIGAGLPEGADTDGNLVLMGMCPGINLYDFRVLDKDGRGDEFNIIAALQFIRWINQYEGLTIHGINLSMSLNHDVETYACGHTPVCVSANRLVDEGVVVVAAAGNQGQSVYQSDSGNASQGFRTVNITDPGNAEEVITVGATHRNEPHRYGVSYFSSKGPTGDGRVKPDLVAPGEKIYSSVLDNGIDAMDGTSMAAPHVSGAAALLMSKHRELVGRPRRIKDILCKTATDLGRERYFQGHGMIDVLRAIQSV